MVVSTQFISMIPLPKGGIRYLHKLGYGGSSTVWLGRDRLKGRLISLKIMTAQASSKNYLESQTLKHLKGNTINHPGHRHIMPFLDEFRVKGPNGSHMCLVSQDFGPSIAQLSYYPGKFAGCRRLRGDIARKLSRQIAEAMSFIHTSGIVYGDLTASNVLLRLNNIDAWSDKEVYERLGLPVQDNILDSTGNAPRTHAPNYLVQPANLSRLDPTYLTKDIVFIDFGQSFRKELPPDHSTGSPPSYCSPETLFGDNMTMESDIWALACTIYETRAGAQLFASFFGGNDEIVRQIVQTFGKLPEPWWSAWDTRSIYFDNDGKPNKTWPNDIPLAVEYPLEAQIRDIGADDEPADQEPLEGTGCGEGILESFMEQPGIRVADAELVDFADFLRAMLKYNPRNRATISQVLGHPWISRTY